ncbi:ribonuclease ZC3H12A [Centropristis striata]|uniref:ribonuclease ZC3H12A n=1 Tax=Centropristis striata TaxID=184440 RepID=UPI0027DFAAD0|nr:ribonuclease ZC3H12A [Centropristis striata]
MNTEVALLTSGHPWSKIPDTTRLNFSDSDTSAWSFPSLLSAPESSRPSCERMFPGEPDPSSGPQHLEAPLNFFLKLGYSTAQVQAVLHKFGNMDTDKLLGKLVKMGANPGPVQVPVTRVSVLVPRGEPPAVGPTMQLPVTVSAHSREDEDALRPVVIDGSNVAMSHGNKEVFSCLGIELAVKFFKDRGHTEITVFVPMWRKEQPRPDVPITDQHILGDLERRHILVFTPSKRVSGKRVVCNDDRFIVRHGYESDGIIVSNDMYRDLQAEKPEWKRFIEERLLMYSFVNNKFMPPDDPLGRHGPTLENFLRKFPKIPKKQICPYGKKCTYGIKCKFHHPERPKQSNCSLADDLRAIVKHSSAQKPSSARSSPVPGQSLSLEDMAKKLTLGHESGSSKKDHKHEQVMVSHRPSKRATARKDKHSSSDHGSVRHSSSQEQLDSGLGSIDSQPIEAPWSVCDHQYGATYGSAPPSHSLRPQYCDPCSCCSSHGPSSQETTPAFQHHNQHYSVPYQHPYPGYDAYPGSLHVCSHPADFQHTRVYGHQQQQYWSDPCGAHPPALHSLSGERSHWKPPQAPSQSRKEREVVRKNLLAIFNANLVDTAMNMFPLVMDPQVLVAEILKLQGQNRMQR